LRDGVVEGLGEDVEMGDTKVPIEQKILALSTQEFSELRAWVLEQDWKSWDEQIEADVRDGKLDKLIAEAQAD
jgi:hypothetical protein